MYDPAIGRWHSVDPVNQFASPYIGIGNNPVNLIDPSGMSAYRDFLEEHYPDGFWYRGNYFSPDPDIQGVWHSSGGVGGAQGGGGGYRYVDFVEIIDWYVNGEYSWTQHKYTTELTWVNSYGLLENGDFVPGPDNSGGGGPLKLATSKDWRSMSDQQRTLHLLKGIREANLHYKPVDLNKMFYNLPRVGATINGEINLNGSTMEVYIDFGTWGIMIMPGFITIVRYDLHYQEGTTWDIMMFNKSMSIEVKRQSWYNWNSYLSGEPKNLDILIKYLAY